jgi:SPASM domain peptide maturase of grasp-with-spasm system
MPIHTYPKSFFDILVNSAQLSVCELKIFYNNRFNQGIDELFNDLIKKGFGFLTKHPQYFPDLSTEFDKCEIISNSVINIDKNSEYFTKLIFPQLNEIGCEAIQLKINECIEFVEIQLNILDDILKNSRIKYVEIIIVNDCLINEKTLSYLLKKNNRIKSIISYDTFTHRKTEICENSSKFKNELYNLSVNQYYSQIFQINLLAFTEAQNHNLYFNRKVAIDKNGDVKNCLTNNKVFGNIKENTIKEVISTPEFRKIWYISKNKIEICKDCEFRFMCIDNREPIHKEDSELFYYSGFCKYNPYTAKWQGHPGFISVEEWRIQNSDS